MKVCAGVNRSAQNCRIPPHARRTERPMSAFAEPPRRERCQAGFRQTTLVCTERHELEAKLNGSSSITGLPEHRT